MRNARGHSSQGRPSRVCISHNMRASRGEYGKRAKVRGSATRRISPTGLRCVPAARCSVKVNACMATVSPIPDWRQSARADACAVLPRTTFAWSQYRNLTERTSAVCARATTSLMSMAWLKRYRTWRALDALRNPSARARARLVTTRAKGGHAALNFDRRWQFDQPSVDGQAGRVDGLPGAANPRPERNDQAARGAQCGPGVRTARLRSQ